MATSRLLILSLAPQYCKHMHNSCHSHATPMHTCELLFFAHATPRHEPPPQRFIKRNHTVNPFNGMAVTACLFPDGTNLAHPNVRKSNQTDSTSSSWTSMNIFLLIGDPLPTIPTSLVVRIFLCDCLALLLDKGGGRFLRRDGV